MDFKWILIDFQLISMDFYKMRNFLLKRSHSPPKIFPNPGKPEDMSSAVVPDGVTWSQVGLSDLGALFQPQ